MNRSIQIGPRLYTFLWVLAILCYAAKCTLVDRVPWLPRNGTGVALIDFVSFSLSMAGFSATKRDQDPPGSQDNPNQLKLPIEKVG